jgi:type III pantothenate kinase
MRFDHWTAVDIGNSWIKFGQYDPDHPGKWIRRGRERWRDGFEIDVVDRPTLWIVASVNRAGVARLQQIVEQSRPDEQIHIINYRDVPISSEVDFPDKTGIDRLCAAVGAKDFVAMQFAAETSATIRPIVVVDIGTAVTVDAISFDGVFLGGAIFLGPLKVLQELNEQTDALPDISEYEFEDNLRPIGSNTEDALKAGTVFSLVGGIKEIVQRQSAVLDGTPEVVVTGGGSRMVQSFLPNTWHLVDDLVLRGIQLTASSILPRHSIES